MELFLKLSLKLPPGDVSPALLERARWVAEQIAAEPEVFSEHDRAQAKARLAELEAKAKTATPRSQSSPDA